MARRLLLISNSTTHPSGYLDHCAENIKTFLGSDVKTVTFVPFALKDMDGYFAKAQSRLKDMGYECNSLHQFEDKSKAVQDAEAIFIGGGNTFRLLTLLYKYNVIAAIQARVAAGMPYMGTSAGSNVACAGIWTTNDMPIVEPPSFKALALVDFQINPHYIEPDSSSTHKGETRAERLIQFHEESNLPVLCLPEGTMLHVQGDDMTLLGKDLPIRLFEQGKEMKTLAVNDKLVLDMPAAN